MHRIPHVAFAHAGYLRSRGESSRFDSPDGLGGTALAWPKKAQQRVRAKAKFASRFKLIWAVQILVQKYSAFVFSEVGDYLCHPTSIAEGRIAIVTKREVGCGGREDADRRAAHLRTVKSCGPGAPMQAPSWRRCSTHRADDGGNKLVHRGEREVSRQTTAQGRPE